MYYKNKSSPYLFKASLTFKCMTDHLFADFSCSVPLDTYLWKQMMQMNKKLIHIWYNVDKKYLLFTKRKCHKFSWLFYGIPFFSQKKIDLHMQKSMKSICIHRSLLAELWFSK